MFQTQTEIRNALDGAGLHPRRRYGQHFLIDRNLMEKLVDAADVGPDDRIFEIGPGTGSLTGELAARAGSVVALEIDTRLAEVARGQLGKFANVRILQSDALLRKSTLAPVFLAEINEAIGSGATLKLVANLPYDIATPLILNILIAGLGFSRLCFTVQKEVGDRLLAKCGEPAYGAAAVLTNVFAKGRRIAAVPARAFWPAPKVASVMIALDPLAADECAVSDRARFASTVRSIFQMRRKTIGRIIEELNLSEKKGAAALAVDFGRRPEELTPAQWIALVRAVA